MVEAVAVAADPRSHRCSDLEDHTQVPAGMDCLDLRMSAAPNLGPSYRRTHIPTPHDAADTRHRQPCESLRVPQHRSQDSVPQRVHRERLSQRTPYSSCSPPFHTSLYLTARHRRGGGRPCGPSRPRGANQKTRPRASPDRTGAQTGIAARQTAKGREHPFPALLSVSFAQPALRQANPPVAELDATRIDGGPAAGNPVAVLVDALVVVVATTCRASGRRPAIRLVVMPVAIRIISV